MWMTDGETRELVNRFFDVYETHQIKEVEKCWADDCVIWYNVFGKSVTKQENLAGMEASWDKSRSRVYNDRVINTFPGGFVFQASMTGVQHNGHHGVLYICIVGQCRDGKIIRMDEYVDSGKLPAWRGPGEDQFKVPVLTKGQ